MRPKVSQSAKDFFIELPERDTGVDQPHEEASAEVHQPGAIGGNPKEMGSVLQISLDQQGILSEPGSRGERRHLSGAYRRDPLLADLERGSSECGGEAHGESFLAAPVERPIGPGQARPLRREHGTPDLAASRKRLEDDKRRSVEPADLDLGRSPLGRGQLPQVRRHPEEIVRGIEDGADLAGGQMEAVQAAAEGGIWRGVEALPQAVVDLRHHIFLNPGANRDEPLVSADLALQDLPSGLTREGLRVDQDEHTGLTCALRSLPQLAHDGETGGDAPADAGRVGERKDAAAPLLAAKCEALSLSPGGQEDE